MNSTVACALVAKKLGIAVAHVEAGLRSHDLTMPEEINRMVTDVLSDLLFVSERSGLENLRKEGKPKIPFILSAMSWWIRFTFSSLEARGKLEVLKSPQGPLPFMTLHRPSNVDDGEKLREIMGA